MKNEVADGIGEPYDLFSGATRPLSVEWTITRWNVRLFAAPVAARAGEPSAVYVIFEPERFGALGRVVSYSGLSAGCMEQSATKAFAVARC